MDAKGFEMEVWKKLMHAQHTPFKKLPNPGSHSVSHLSTAKTLSIGIMQSFNFIEALVVYLLITRLFIYKLANMNPHPPSIPTPHKISVTDPLQGSSKALPRQSLLYLASTVFSAFVYESAGFTPYSTSITFPPFSTTMCDLHRTNRVKN